MKTRVVLFVILFCINNFSQTTVSPLFSELKGMEDLEGNAHLFYRIYSYEATGLSSTSHNDIYHLDLYNDLDTLFLQSSGYSNPVMSGYYSVDHYDFWNSDFRKFIYSGSWGGSVDPGPPFIKRFDGEEINFDVFWGESGKVNISKQNDSLIIAGASNTCCSEGDKTFKSTDGGWNWFTLSDSLQFISLSPFDDNVMFSISGDGTLYKSTDGGNTFYVSDTKSYNSYNDDFLFDNDQIHIYRQYFDYPNHILLVSNNKGENGSWKEKFITESKISICIDDSVSGSLFLAEGNTINQSRNYGENFFPVVNLESDVVGMYKKPNSDILYAATKYRIYEMNVNYDSLKIIKSITPASENFDWFPLAVGNLWAYENYHIENRDFIFSGYSWNYIYRTVKLSNEKKYFEMIDRSSNGIIDTLFLRYDSLTADIYMYDIVKGVDILYEKLSAELGDTVCYDNPYFWGCQIVQNEEPLDIWELSTSRKEIYPDAVGWLCSHSLVRGIGLYESGCADLYGWSSDLVGCVINGITYGDTTVVSVGNDNEPVVSNFKLEQNYPNPFNPTTKISWQSPVGSWQTLKVYDILGNEISTIVNEYKPAGEYEVEFNATDLPSGVYFYQLKAGNFIKTNKMILLK